MEDTFVYNPESVIPEAFVEGIEAIKTVTLAWQRYVRECNEYENGLRDTIPEKPKEDILAVELKHYGAAVYLATEQWINACNPIMVRLGKEAQERLLNGDDPCAVMDDMNNRFSAFMVAQGG